MTIKFDPLALLPDNIAPTISRIEALVEFVEDNERLPTAFEVESLLGVMAIDYGSTTDPLPDGYAGRDWNNPNWLKRLVNNA